jgi:hypothetical protein
MVTAKGGDGYWNPHPDDDPMAIVGELIPSRQRKRLGVAPNQMGIRVHVGPSKPTIRLTRCRLPACCSTTQFGGAVIRERISVVDSTAQSQGHGGDYVRSGHRVTA